MLSTNAHDILRALKTLRAPAYTGEYDLHGLISTALDEAGLAFEHERKLAVGMRADFFIGGCVVEVKKGRPVRSKLIRQAARYLGCEGVTSLIVVANKNAPLPNEILGKPVYMLSLDKLWGVSLP